MSQQFRNLVFEGGGVKGIAFAGALAILEERSIMPDIVRVGGTSAGAVTACLLALGASSRDIAEIVGGTDFRSFMDDSFGKIRDTKRLLEDYGWYKGDEFSAWIRRHIKRFTGDEQITFVQLSAGHHEGAYGTPRPYMTGTNLVSQEAEVYSAETTPDMPIWLAVRISMSIPLFFAAVKNGDERVRVDGGVSWNYPLDLFDEARYLSDPLNRKIATEVDYPTARSVAHVYNKETLGLRVDTADEIKAKRERRQLPAEFDDLPGYLKALLTFILDSANKQHLHENDWHRSVFIDALGVRATDFDLSDEQVAMLIQSGRDGAEDYLRWFEAGNPPPLNRVEG